MCFRLRCLRLPFGVVVVVADREAHDTSRMVSGAWMDGHLRAGALVLARRDELESLILAQSERWRHA